MTAESSAVDATSWSLRGPWLLIHRLTLVGLPVASVVAVVVLVVKYMGTTPPPWWLTVVIVAVLAFLLWVQVRTATTVVLDADGELELRRSLLGPVRVPASSVRSIGRPMFGGSRAGVRVRAESVTVPLAVGMPRLHELAGVLTEYNPQLRIGDL